MAKDKDGQISVPLTDLKDALAVLYKLMAAMEKERGAPVKCESADLLMAYVTAAGA